jgi:hypothetical protein
VAARGGEEAMHLTSVERPRFRSGVVFATLGACVLLGTTFAPIPKDSRQAENVYRIFNQQPARILSHRAGAPALPDQRGLAAGCR